MVHSHDNRNTEFGRLGDVRTKYVPKPLQWCDKPIGNDLTGQRIDAGSKRKSVGSAGRVRLVRSRRHQCNIQDGVFVTKFIWEFKRFVSGVKDKYEKGNNIKTKEKQYAKHN